MTDHRLGFLGDVIALVMILGVIGSGTILYRDKTRPSWVLRMFDSQDQKIQLHLYFGMVAIVSLCFYTGYAVVVRGFAFDTAGFGKALAFTFCGIGIGAIGRGLQAREDGTMLTRAIGDDPSFDGAVKLFQEFCDSNNQAREMHLFLGAFSIIIYILFTGYDLAYTAQSFDPSNYGMGLCGVFTGVGAASWGQGLQRRLQARTSTEAS